MWYHRLIGKERARLLTRVADGNGRDHDESLPGQFDKAGQLHEAAAGIIPAIVDPRGNPVGKNQGGWLVMTQPWPGMLRGIWGDDDRFKEVYWGKVPGMYLAGDNARCDDDGYYWIMAASMMCSMFPDMAEHDRRSKVRLSRIRRCGGRRGWTAG